MLFAHWLSKVQRKQARPPPDELTFPPAQRLSSLPELTIPHHK